MAQTPATPLPGAASSASRLAWLDMVKGIAILWIVLFHFFLAYDNGRHPWPLDLASFRQFMGECTSDPSRSAPGCFADGLVAALFQRGPHAVGVFIVLSGFGLTYSLTKTGYPAGGWGPWYRRRLLRLFPMYWLAHFIVLISPFTHLEHPIDARFFLSFLGDRVYPVDTMFYYLVPAWWFFGLLVQLYLVFPLLFRLMQKLGPWRFLILCILITVVSRLLLYSVIHASGNYMQGGFFGGRLWEFGAGMSLAALYRRSPSAVEERLFSGPTFFAGVGLYTLGVYSYMPLWTFSLTDGLIGTGLFILMAHAAYWSNRLPLRIPRSALVYVGAYSYSLYLLHQPYMLYFGRQFRHFDMGAFVLLACVVTGGITLAVIPVEWTVNRYVSRWFDSPAGPRKPARTSKA